MLDEEENEDESEDEEKKKKTKKGKAAVKRIRVFRRGRLEHSRRGAWL